MKKLKTQLELLEDEYNSHPRESARLLELCSNDIHILAELYYRLQVIYNGFHCPSTKQEVKKILSVSLDIKHKSGLLGRLNSQYTIQSFNPTQYGCQWCSNIQLPSQYFWNRRSDFKLLNFIN